MRNQGNLSQAQDISQRVASRAVGEHLARKINYGDEATGWEGDPFLVLTYDPDDYWRVWDTRNGHPDLVCQKKADGSEINTAALTSALRDASHRRQSHKEIMDRVDRHNEIVQAEMEKAEAEAISEQAERMAFDIGKTLD